MNEARKMGRGGVDGEEDVVLLLASVYLRIDALLSTPSSSFVPSSAAMSSSKSSLFSLTGGVPLAKQDFAACVPLSSLFTPLIDLLLFFADQLFSPSPSSSSSLSPSSAGLVRRLAPPSSSLRPQLPMSASPLSSSEPSSRRATTRTGFSSPSRCVASGLHRLFSLPSLASLLSNLPCAPTGPPACWTCTSRRPHRRSPSSSCSTQLGAGSAQ